MSSKRCFKCGIDLPLESFYRHAQMADGHLNKCKECTKKDVIENRITKIEYYRSFDKARASMPHRVAARKAYAQTEAGKDRHRAANANWVAKSPDRRKASHAVNNALRYGKIKKLPCLVCGSRNVEAHHPDYSRPLDVVWLCVEHHKEIHWHMKEAA